MPIAPCVLYGTHQMVSQGYCVVKDYVTKENIDYLIGWYKCGCTDRFICEGSPHFGSGWSIGHYCTEGAIKGIQVSSSGATSILVDTNLIYYTSSSTLEGYKFIAQ